MTSVARYLLLYLLVFTLNTIGFAKSPVVDGSVDLSNYKSEELALYGDWFFFPGELLGPSELLEKLKQKPQTIKVMTNYAKASPELLGDDTGYATYAVKLLNPPKHQALGLVFSATYTAAKVYIFDPQFPEKASLLTEIGRVATNKQEAEAQLGSLDIYDYNFGEASEAYLIVQTSNYHFPWGGIWIPPTIGELAKIQRAQLSNSRIFSFLMGIIAFIAFYNFSMFIKRPEDKSALILGFFSSFLLLRTFTFLNYGTGTILSDKTLDFEFSYRTINSVMIVLPWLIMEFINSAFPRQKHASIDRIIRYGCIASALSIMVLPTMITGKTSTLVILGTGLLSIYNYSKVVIAAIRREPESLISLVGFSGAIATVVIEVAVALGIISFGANMISFGMAFYAAFQTQILSARFARAFRTAEKLSRDLQIEVDKQTREIRSILDNMQQGIFTIDSEDMEVGPRYSPFLEKIVNSKELTGTNLRDLLWKRSKFAADTIDQAEASITSIIGEDSFNFEANGDLLPTEVELVDGEKTKILEVDWAPIVNDLDSVEKLLVSLRDVTAIRQLEKEARKSQQELQTLLNLMQLGEEKFTKFAHKAQDYIEQDLKILESHEIVDNSNLRALYINLHTLKGISRTFSLHELAGAIHEVESNISQLQKNSEQANAKSLREEHRSIENSLNAYINLAKMNLQWFQEHEYIKIEKALLEKLLPELAILNQENNNPDSKSKLEELEAVLRSTTFTHLEDLIYEVSHGLDSLARDLKKAPPNLDIQHSGIFLDSKASDALSSAFTHLLRNSLDHGLEAADERERQGKTAAGNLIFEVETNEQWLILSYHDDGKGLDLERIHKIACDKKIIEPSATLSPSETAMLIFEPGFSTKSEVTDISGRGVGMDAVKSMLEGIGGSVELITKESSAHSCVAARFVLRIPRELWWDQSQVGAA